MIDTDSLSLMGWSVFVLMNTVSFLVMLWDKTQSRRSGAERISEGMLFFLAACFGSIGVLLGMFAFRHKTSKWYFLIGIPLLIAENLALLKVVSEQW
ncbi:MAG: DUF1294 domain-containing protein [Candidatus Moranbacteria bacterium]|nr:DUF1294 domain-containing protein [Candidatus Moranbacteria bacterium]